MLNDNQEGSHVLGILLAIAVLSLTVLVGYKLFHQSSTTKSGDVVVSWKYDQEKLEWYTEGGEAPKCKDPLLFDISPVELSKVTAIGLPGSYRGFNYKAHGGFRLLDSTEGGADIRLPMDMNLTGITRYYESIPGYPDELQYILDFENDCGIAIRFDHLHTLTPDFMSIAETTPQPKKNETNRNSEKMRRPFKQGDVIATKVGFPSAKNYGFDFGVYDYRQRNKISSNSQWADIQSQFSASTFHGICWIPLLPANDASKAESISKDRNNYNSNKPFNLTSDYCEFAPYRSLDFNNGQPVEG